MRSLLVALLLAACAPEPARTDPPNVSGAQALQVAADASRARALVAPAPASDAADAAPTRAEPAENDPRWHATVRAIASGYERWGRVDDEMRWAPYLCKMPRPARARISASEDESTHGRKLYTLWARDPVAYGARPSALPAPDEQPGLSDISQAIVKEAWAPVETTEPRGAGVSAAEHGGKLYLPGERMGLYVLFKPTRTDVATDAGWVYATIAADRQTITAAGKIASCMGCHQALPGRLFGLAAPGSTG